MTFRTTDLSPRIGTLVEVDRDTLISGRATQDIRDLLEQRGVIAIRDMEVADEEQLALTRTFGRSGSEGTGEVHRVSYDQKENPVGAGINAATAYWHIDRTDTDVPPFASMLSAKVLSPTGGETEFANTYAAYDDLPEADKALIEDLKVEHRLETAFREAIPHPTAEQEDHWKRIPAKIHPLVWRHRSGKRSLILSNSATRVVGMDDETGRALIARLLQWATQPEYVYTHDWRLGDLVMWNNTGTMHRVRYYDPAAGRKLHRTTVLGDEPFSAAAETPIGASA